MGTETKNRYARYFGIVVIVGVAMNFAIAVPSLIVPGTILSWIGLPAEVTEFWVRLACWLLLLLSLSYIPTAIDPYRSPAHSCLTVGARWGAYSSFRSWFSRSTLISGTWPSPWPT